MDCLGREASAFGGELGEDFGCGSVLTWLGRPGGGCHRPQTVVEASHCVRG